MQRKADAHYAGRALLSAAAILAVLLALLATGLWPFLQFHRISTQDTFSQPISGVQHVIIIVMENKGYSTIIGNSSAPYINGLASNFSLAADYYAVTHPSLPNYLSMIAGYYPVKTDCNNTVGPGCVQPASQQTIVNLLGSAGISWGAYAEGMPSSCWMKINSPYYPKHVPFLYFANITGGANNESVPPQGNTNCQNHVTEMGNLSSRTGPFYSALATNTLPSFVFLTPNICDDMHNKCAGPTEIAQGNKWLSQVVPIIENSSSWPSTVVFITWDEAASTDKSGFGNVAGGKVPLIVVSPFAKKGYVSTGYQYSHYSLLATTEWLFNIGNLGRNDSNASIMQDMFVIPSSTTTTASTSSTTATTTLTTSSTTSTATTSSTSASSSTTTKASTTATSVTSTTTTSSSSTSLTTIASSTTSVATTSTASSSSTSSASTVSTTVQTTTASTIQGTGGGASSTSTVTSSSTTTVARAGEPGATPYFTSGLKCYSISNLSASRHVNVTIGNYMWDIGINYVARGAAEISVNGNPYIIPLNESLTLFGESNGGYSARLYNISYSTSPQSIFLDFCGPAVQNIRTVNTTGSSVLLYVSGNDTPIAINFTSANATIEVDSSSNSIVAADISAVRLPNTTASPPSGYSKLLLLGISATGNVSVNVTAHYQCGLNQSIIVPYVLNSTSGAWNRVSSFALNASSCSARFPAPSTSSVGLFEELAPVSSTGTTTIGYGHSGQALPLNGENLALIIGVILVVGAVVAYHIERKRHSQGPESGMNG